MLRLRLVAYGVQCVFEDSGVEYQPSGGDSESYIVAGEVLVRGSNNAPDIVSCVDRVVIDDLKN